VGRGNSSPSQRGHPSRLKRFSTLAIQTPDSLADELVSSGQSAQTEEGIPWLRGGLWRGPPSGRFKLKKPAVNKGWLWNIQIGVT
jgi:hypothetical protein